MKNKQNHGLRSSGLLSLLGLVALALAIVAVPWNRKIQDSQTQAARQKAEVVGYQVAQIYREATGLEAKNAQLGGRNPASEGGFSLENLRSTGTMGMDPWGEPYRYRILSSAKPGAVRVLVWSSGPNRKVESAGLDDESQSIKNQPVYNGDDMGVLLSVAQN